MGSIVIPQPVSELVSARIKVGRKRTYLHLLLAVTFSLLFVAVVAAIGFHGYIAWILGRPTVAPLSSNPREAIGLAYEDVTFPSANGKSMLNGWYIPSTSISGIDAARTVVFSHGYGANREEDWVPMYDLANAAHMAGFNVLMFDYGFVNPGHVATGGVQEREELKGAIQLVKQKGAQQIYVWGFSMGAGTALQTALDSKDITGMILDSTFLLTPDTLYHNIHNLIQVPRNPSLSLIRWFFPIMNGVSLHEVPYERVLSAHYSIPIFMIHGDQDEKAPVGLAESIFSNQQLQPLSRMWELPEGKHELIYAVKQKEYLQRTLAFLQDVSSQADLAATTVASAADAQ